jgi:hypothetical protein
MKTVIVVQTAKGELTFREGVNGLWLNTTWRGHLVIYEGNTLIAYFKDWWHYTLSEKKTEENLKLKKKKIAS